MKHQRLSNCLSLKRNLDREPHGGRLELSKIIPRVLLDRTAAAIGSIPSDAVVRDGLNRDVSLMSTTLHNLPDRAAFSVAEVCAQTGIGRDTVYNAIRSGQLSARRLGRRMIVTPKDLERFLVSLPKAGTSQAG